MKIQNITPLCAVAMNIRNMILKWYTNSTPLTPKKGDKLLHSVLNTKDATHFAVLDLNIYNNQNALKKLDDFIKYCTSKSTDQRSTVTTSVLQFVIILNWIYMMPKSEQ